MNSVEQRVMPFYVLQRIVIGDVIGAELIGGRDKDGVVRGGRRWREIRGVDSDVLLDDLFMVIVWRLVYLQRREMEGVGDVVWGLLDCYCFLVIGVMLGPENRRVLLVLMLTHHRVVAEPCRQTLLDLSNRSLMIPPAFPQYHLYLNIITSSHSISK